eukprot:203488-Rhodomonas_salina.1
MHRPIISAMYSPSPGYASVESRRCALPGTDDACVCWDQAECELRAKELGEAREKEREIEEEVGSVGQAMAEHLHIFSQQVRGWKKNRESERTPVIIGCEESFIARVPDQQHPWH